MKGLRKFLSLVLVVVMAFSVAPNAFAWGEIDVLVVGTPAAKAKFSKIYCGEEIDVNRFFYEPGKGEDDYFRVTDKVNKKIQLRFQREYPSSMVELVANPHGDGAIEVPSPTTNFPPVTVSKGDGVEGTGRNPVPSSPEGEGPGNQDKKPGGEDTDEKTKMSDTPLSKEQSPSLATASTRRQGEATGGTETTGSGSATQREETEEDQMVDTPQQASPTELTQKPAIPGSGGEGSAAERFAEKASAGQAPMGVDSALIQEEPLWYPRRKRAVPSVGIIPEVPRSIGPEIPIVIAAVDADQPLEDVKSDIANMVDRICDARVNHTQIIVVCCSEDSNNVASLVALNNYVVDIERYCTRNGWGTSHNQRFTATGQFLSSCALNSKRVDNLRRLILSRADDYKHFKKVDRLLPEWMGSGTSESQRLPQSPHSSKQDVCLLQ